MPARKLLSHEWQVWLTPIEKPSMHTAQSTYSHYNKYKWDDRNGESREPAGEGIKHQNEIKLVSK